LPTTYLQRILAEARKKEEWPLMKRVLECFVPFDPSGAFVSTNDRNTLQSFVTGLNQEKARQYAFAVSSYEAALKTGSQVIPAEMIGEHLENIRKNNPKEFEQGLQLATNPPPPTYDPRAARPAGYPPSYTIPTGRTISPRSENPVRVPPQAPSDPNGIPGPPK